jgi:hypothetical protein
MWLKAISAAFKTSMEVFASLAIQWAVIAMGGGWSLTTGQM